MFWTGLWRSGVSGIFARIKERLVRKKDGNRALEMKFSSRNEMGQARKKGTVADEDPFRAGGARKQPFRLEIIQKYKRYVSPSFLSHPDPNPLPRNPCCDSASLLLSSPEPRRRPTGVAAPPPFAVVSRCCRSLPTAVDFE